MTIQSPQVDANHHGIFTFDNIMSVLNNAIETRVYDVNDRECHIALIKQMATLELQLEHSNWIIGEILNGSNPVNIYKNFIINFIPSLPFDNPDIINTAINTLENAYMNFTYDRNSIDSVLTKLVELPLNEYQFEWIKNQIQLSTIPIDLMMTFIENFILNNSIENHHIIFNQIIISCFDYLPLNPLAYFSHMPQWLFLTIGLSISRNTGIAYDLVKELMDKHENIIAVANEIFTNYHLYSINIYFRDRNTNRLHGWTMCMS
jgi:hypothetical protein